MGHKIDEKIKAKAAKYWTDNNKASRKISKSEVAERFGISIRTLSRAIDALASGVTTKPKKVKATKKKKAPTVEPVVELEEELELDVESVVELEEELEVELEEELEVELEEELEVELEEELEVELEEELEVELELEEEPDFKYIGSKSSITISNGSESCCVPKDDTRYQEVIDNILTGNLSNAWIIANQKVRIEEFTSGEVTIKKGQVYINGVRVHNDVTKRLITMMETGADESEITKFCNFFTKLMDHHSTRVVDELLGFLEHMSIELCDDGTFFAYRAVSSNFRDKHSGKFDNSVGKTVKMPRTMVNDDKTQTCSTGLHFASYSYASRSFGSSGDQLIKVRIDPVDVISIPVDYNNQKGRCCRFEVVEHVKTL